MLVQLFISSYLVLNYIVNNMYMGPVNITKAKNKQKLAILGFSKLEFWIIFIKLQNMLIHHNISFLLYNYHIIYHSIIL